MTRWELPDDVALDHLLDEAATLEEGIDNLGEQISRALQGHADGHPLQRSTLSDVHELHEAKQALVFKLGRATARIEEVEMRMAGRDLRQQASSPAHKQAPAPPRNENRLGWLGIRDRGPLPSPEVDQRPEPEQNRSNNLNRSSPRTEASMENATELEDLRKHSVTLNRAIRRTNRELERALREAAAGRTGRALRILESRFERYADMMFELGTVTERIRDLRTRGYAHEERGWDRLDNDRQEHAAVAEDRLSWLGLSAPARKVGREERDAEHERDLPRGREPDDDRDWWKR